MQYALDLQGERPELTDSVILSNLLYPSDFSSPLSYVMITMKFAWSNA